MVRVAKPKTVFAPWSSRPSTRSKEENVVGEWLSKYESGGFTALLQIKSPGAPPGQRSLPENVLVALSERLKDTTGFGSYIELQIWLKETHSVSIRYNTLHRIVRYQLQAKPKIPRRSHEKKYHDEEAAFREEFPDKLKDLIEEQVHLAGNQNIRFLAQDESRLGLMPTTRRRITAKGVKPIQKVQFQFESYYLYGAVEPLTGESFFLELPWLNGMCFEAFLNELSAFYTDNFMIMLTDNASAHKAKKLVMPDNILLELSVWWFIQPICQLRTKKGVTATTEWLCGGTFNPLGFSLGLHFEFD